LPPITASDNSMLHEYSLPRHRFRPHGIPGSVMITPE
jgi:hypothetical protein